MGLFDYILKNSKLDLLGILFLYQKYQRVINIIKDT